MRVTNERQTGIGVQEEVGRWFFVVRLKGHEVGRRWSLSEHREPVKQADSVVRVSGVCIVQFARDLGDERLSS